MGERMGKAPPSPNPIRQGNDSLGTPIFLNPLDPQITHLPLLPLPPAHGSRGIMPLAGGVEDRALHTHKKREFSLPFCWSSTITIYN